MTQTSFNLLNIRIILPSIKSWSRLTTNMLYCSFKFIRSVQAKNKAYIWNLVKEFHNIQKFHIKCHRIVRLTKSEKVPHIYILRIKGKAWTCSLSVKRIFDWYFWSRLMLQNFFNISMGVSLRFDGNC